MSPARPHRRHIVRSFHTLALACSSVLFRYPNRDGPFTGRLFRFNFSVAEYLSRSALDGSVG
jgi:hypothetical protein